MTLASSCGGDKATAPTSLPPASATAISSTSVQARVGDILDGPFGVRVADKNGAVLAGISVGCQVVAGNGTLTKATATTGADGVATCGLWTLGTAPGIQEISINVGSLAPVKYIASAVPRPASQLTVVRALSVQVSSGKPPSETPIVQLLDDFGNTAAAEGATVSVSTDPPSTIEGGTSATNQTGRAEFPALRIRGTRGPRTITYTASIGGAKSSGTFTLLAGDPIRLDVVAALPQSVRSGVQIDSPFRVQLRDAEDNPAGGPGRAFTLSVAGLALAGGTATTNDDGLASFPNLTIRGRVGAYTLVAASATFADTARVPFQLVAGLPAQVVMETVPSVVQRLAYLMTPQPVARLLDADSNTVRSAGQQIRARPLTSGANAIGGTAVTDAEGRAAFSGLGVVGNSGSHTLSFEAAGLLSAIVEGISFSAPPGDSIPGSVAYGTLAQKRLILDSAISLLPALTVRSTNGSSLTGLLVGRSIEDESVVRLAEDGTLVAVGPGRSWVVAETFLGAAPRDSLLVYVTRNSNGPLVLTDFTQATLFVGQEFEVRLLVRSRQSGPLSAVTLDLSWPQRWPYLLNLVNHVAATGSTVTPAPVAGLARVSWTNVNGVSGEIELARFRFRVIGAHADPNQFVVTPLEMVAADLRDLFDIVTVINPPFIAR